MKFWLREVLSYLHNRIPPVFIGNIMPRSIKCGEDRICLLDLSVTVNRLFSIGELTVGANRYAAPEWLSKGVLDARSDIYSLGVNLYSMLTGDMTGRKPIGRSALRSANPAVSVEMEAIVYKCLELAPDDRFQSCAELMTALG